jgi:hypothetical protein
LVFELLNVASVGRLFHFSTRRPRFVWLRAAVSLPFPFLAAVIAMVIGKS